MNTSSRSLAYTSTAILLGALALAGSGGPAHATALPSQESEPDIEALLERFSDLNSSHRERLLEDCTAAARASGAPQVELIERWAAELEVDDLPERTEFEAHDALKYKGGPKRKTIGRRKDLWNELNGRLRRSPADPRVIQVRPVLYEYSTGSLVQRESKKQAKARRKLETGNPSPMLEFGDAQPLRELLEGVLPDQTLAEAALLQALDSSDAYRKEASYFAHLYCDREANAYEGMSLFDLWGLPDELEVPDPDARAYAQLIWDDDTVPVPLKDYDHDFWYPRMERSYKDLRTHMFTTRALAAVWFEGRPELSSGYEVSIDIMNAAIALADFEPAGLAELLQTAGPQFLHEAKRQIDDQGNDVWNAGNARRDEFAAGKVMIREAVLEVLASEGLLE